MPEEYALVWDKIADKYASDPVTAAVHDEHIEIFRNALVDGNVLDVGCATGKHLAHLRQNGFNAVGLDISKRMLFQSMKLLKSSNMNPNLIQASATNLPFKAESFDNIICMGNSIGMIPGKENRLAAIKDILRVTKNITVFELLKSDTTEEVRSKYWFSDDTEEYAAKRWDEEEIIDLIKKLDIEVSYEIIKGRKSLLEKYLFYVILRK